MADVEIPDGLLQARHAFLAAQERLSAVSRTLPAHATVAAGEAEPASEEQQQEWMRLQAECRRLAVAIQEHPDWEQVEDRKAVRKALDAVTASGDGPQGAA
ncbi:hypothetical protein AB0L65_33205 [Nonomuraea sp. NPDC052116]|uniref:hypothetical protein n=1 Tax=Nonomuraea sp. NPDC052116 TaxID=3155665 RepID=UPI0034321CB2